MQLLISSDGNISSFGSEGLRPIIQAGKYVEIAWSLGAIAVSGDFFLVPQSLDAIYVFDNQGKNLAIIKSDRLQKIEDICVDARNNIYVICSHGEVQKFDCRGKLLHTHPISNPCSLFLSRHSSNEMFLAVTQKDSNAITVFQSSCLDRLVTQDLSFAATGMLNSELVDPTLVYMSDRQNNRVVVFEDYGRKFHYKCDFKVGVAPSKIIESESGIFVVCQEKGELWWQKNKGEQFIPYSLPTEVKVSSALSLLERLQIKKTIKSADTSQAVSPIKDSLYLARVQKLLSNVAKIGNNLENSGTASDAAAKMDGEAFKLMADHGLLHLTLPRDLGGEEILLDDLIEIISRVAYWDSTAGWASSISCAGGIVLSYFDPKLVVEMFSKESTIFLSGSHAPTGRLKRHEKHWVMDGSWTWCSFCEHAKWFMVQAVIQNEKGEMQYKEDGMPETSLALIPAAKAKIEPIWDVFGMKGTGSHRVHVDGLVVEDQFIKNLNQSSPLHKSDLYKVPTFSLLSASIAAVALGIAERALDDAKVLFQTKVPQASKQSLMVRSSVKVSFATAMAKINSAKAFITNQAKELQQKINLGQALSTQDRADMRLACSWTVKSSCEAVDLLYQSAGGAAVFMSNPLQKHFRDIHVITQHMGVAENTLEMLGEVQIDGTKDFSLL